jgi:zinc protease
LVDTELASSVSGNLPLTLDPYLYTVSATVRAGRTPHQVEEAVWAEVERLVKEPAGQEELNKALKQAKAQFAYASESVTNQALWLGFAEMLRDYGWFMTFIDQLNQVTLEDVHRVATKYLARRNSTVGWFVPVDAASLERTNEQ